MKHAPYAGTPAVEQIEGALRALSSRGIYAWRVADRLGYTPQMIAMFKGGAAKVPLPKVAPLARALEIDPDIFFNAVVRSYYPHLKGKLK